MSDTEQDLRKDIVDELKTFFNTKLDEIKKDFRADTECAAESARKKVRLDSFVSLKNASNRKQYFFNTELEELLDNTKKAVELRDASKAYEFIAEAKEKIKHRNKLIRIADSSQAGWATIQEYELYDVASDSDDDKRIRRAEERAKSRLEMAKKSAERSDNSASTSFRSFRRDTNRGLVGRSLERAQVVCCKCGNLGHFASGCAADFQSGSSMGSAQSTSSSGSTPVHKEESADVAK